MISTISDLLPAGLSTMLARDGAGAVDLWRRVTMAFSVQTPPSAAGGPVR
jgi:hypothetical protein